MRRLLVYSSALGSAGWFLAVASRPAASIWTVLDTWMLCVLIVLGVSGVVLLERLTNTRWALGVATTTTVTMVTGIRLESGPLVVGAGLFIMALATGTAVASLAKGIPEGRPVAIAAGLFAASHLAAPAAQPAALWLFEDDFVSFAEDVRAGNMPDTESFRVGPYSYDSVCPTNDGDVTIWHSGDDFITVQTVVVHPDGAITDGALGESSSFVYDCNRRRLDHG